MGTYTRDQTWGKTMRFFILSLLFVSFLSRSFSRHIKDLRQSRSFRGLRNSTSGKFIHAASELLDDRELTLKEIKAEIKGVSSSVRSLVDLINGVKEDVNGVKAEVIAVKTKSDVIKGETDTIKKALTRLHEATDIPVRLVNGDDSTNPESPSKGRVEVYHNEEWGSICDDYFDNNDATVICKALGYASGTTEGNIIHSAGGSTHQFGKGSGKIWIYKMECTGEETTVGQCGITWNSNIYSDNCDHEEDADVVCSS